MHVYRVCLLYLLAACGSRAFTELPRVHTCVWDKFPCVQQRSLKTDLLLTVMTRNLRR